MNVANEGVGEASRKGDKNPRVTLGIYWLFYLVYDF